MSKTGRKTVERAAALLVFVLAGGLFATSAVTSKNTKLRSETTSLVQLVSETSLQVERTAQQVSELQERIDHITATANNPLAPAIGDLRATSHLTPINGAGLTVTLTDAPDDFAVPEGVDANQLVVHQQDIEAVVNTLWAADAHGITVMDQRLIGTSSVQCVGNTLRLQGRVYAPPYTITAVGDQAKLLAALRDSPQLKLYRHHAQTVGLGYRVERFSNKQLPGYVGSVSVKYAVPNTP